MALLTQDQITNLPTIAEGDAGIIFKKDGSFQVFNTANLDPANLTERQIEQGVLIMAFTAALRMPDILQMLVDIATDPNIVGEAVELPAVRN